MPRFLAIAILAAALVGGCASTPQASADRDREAKEFGSHPGSSTIYIYRSQLNRGRDDSTLFVNGRIVGATLPGGYFVVNVDPGVQQLNGMGPDNGRLSLETRSGELYFISLTVNAGQSVFEPVAPAVGRKAIENCCVLMETWRPGQRPLLH